MTKIAKIAALKKSKRMNKVRGEEVESARFLQAVQEKDDFQMMEERVQRKLGRRRKHHRISQLIMF